MGLHPRTRERRRGTRTRLSASQGRRPSWDPRTARPENRLRDILQILQDIPSRPEVCLEKTSNPIPPHIPDCRAASPLANERCSFRNATSSHSERWTRKGPGGLGSGWICVGRDPGGKCGRKWCGREWVGLTSSFQMVSCSGSGVWRWVRLGMNHRQGVGNIIQGPMIAAASRSTDPPYGVVAGDR